jgi:hypothetical protein
VEHRGRAHPRSSFFVAFVSRDALLARQASRVLLPCLRLLFPVLLCGLKVSGACVIKQRRCSLRKQSIGCSRLLTRVLVRMLSRGLFWVLGSAVMTATLRTC